ncbi:MAG: trypsin-like serine protease [Myxococcales bacterium]|nr:trypsin-like serine protease [Myxococcales bacterium]
MKNSAISKTTAVAATVLLLASSAWASLAAGLSKSEVFDRCAPATALIVLATPSGSEVGSGVVVDPKGLLITNYHVVADAPRARSFAVFLYDPKERIVEEDLRAYLDSHKSKALQPKVLRVDVENDLALLQLPERKGGYPFVAWGDSDAAKVGQDVIAIGNPQGLAWTLTSGSISAIRKNALQTETAINPGNSGGPLLDMDAKLIGINTYIRRNAQSLGFARPVNLVRGFVEQKGDLGHAIAGAQPTTPQAGKAESPVHLPSGAQMSVLVKRLFADIEKRFPGEAGKRVLCALFSAMTYSGRTVVSGVGDVAWLNDSLAAALESVPKPDRAKSAQYIEQNLPLLAISTTGKLWLRSGAKYFDVGPATAMDVDDVTGQIYATDQEGNVVAYDRGTGSWKQTGIGQARDIEASEGVLYVLDKAGIVSAVVGAKRSPLSQRPVQGSLLATRGTLYVLDQREGALFRWKGGHWDKDGEPIAKGVREVRANGPTWYGLDRGGGVYSGTQANYIDREGDLIGIWLMGDDLLGLDREGVLHHWHNQAQKWHALTP